MKTKTLILFCILFLNSCRLEPPNLGDDDDNIYFVDPSAINVICTESTWCAPSTDTNYDFYLYYTLDSCDDFVLDTSPVAVGYEASTCNSTSCSAAFIEYTERWDSENLVNSLREDEYTILTFVDIDANGSIDDDEPYFCTEGIDIGELTEISSLDIEITRLKVVTE